MNEGTAKSSAESPRDPDLSGRHLGDYQLLRRLASGGMADVYLAEQQSLRRQVAFKILRSSLAEDETYVRRFHNEAQAAAALVHANIVQIYEVGCIDGIHFIAQEYVPGQNLKQFLKRRGPLKVRTAVNVMRQVASALHRAGQRGIVHRDIKPENIMLAPDGEVKVADFGLARVTGDGGQLNLTEVGVTLGTPLYMSPEQIESRELDPRSDIYSFGVTCYEMLTGQPPFQGDTALSVALQHVRQEPRRLEEHRPDLPPELCRIVHKMLAKDPARRYQDPAELLRDLRTLSAEQFGDDWSVETEQWNSTEMVELSRARMEATQQLATVMKNESRLMQQARRTGWWLASLIVALGVGCMVAYVTNPRSPLVADANETPRVEKQESAEAQFWYALDQGTEEAFRAVLEYFPAEANQANEAHVNKAKLQLAYLYRESDRTDEAIELLEELASQNTDRLLQASALAELANIHAVRGEQFKANNRLGQLVKLLADTDRLSPRDRESWSQVLHSSLRAQFERLLEDYPLSEGEGRSPRDRRPGGGPGPPGPPRPFGN